MSFKDIFSKIDIEFIDRDDLFDVVKDEYYCLSAKEDYLSILSIYGMGGIGKSRLLTEIKNEIQSLSSEDNNLKIIYITLEITSSDNYLDALIKLRKQINRACPLFDYAILTYWQNSEITKIDDSFLQTLKSQWFEILKDFSSLISYPFTKLSPFVSLPLDTIIEIIDKVFKICKTKHYSSLFTNKIKDISEFSEDELRQCLGAFLGMELKHLYNKKNLFIIIDAYEHRKSINFVDWFFDLIEQTTRGIFIVSSREMIKFPNELKNNVISIELSTLPTPLVKKLLKKSIPIASNKTINHIINITECVPIYLDLAINTYQSVCANNLTIDETTFFMYTTKEDLISKFFSHLKSGEQEFMLALSFVQIFDQDIFEMLLSVAPMTSIFAYNEIQSLSLVSNITNDNNFFKIHNVINTNVIKIMPEKIRYTIFRKYMEHIFSKSLFFASDIQKIVLYKHLISMVIKNNFILNQDDTEVLLDIFFQLKQTLKTVLPNGIPGFAEYTPLKDIYYFTKTITDERQDTKIRMEWLSEIDFSNNTLGKHNKSLKIIHGYLSLLRGDDKKLARYLSVINPTLKKQEIREWYYAQTKIFWADHLTTIGQFSTAETELITFQNEIMQYSDQENSSFQTKRHLGHIYRFNLLFEKANETYLSTKGTESSFKNSVQKIYIYTNLCETNCYTNPRVVFEYCFSALKLGKTLNDSKSSAKIYYSMAIAFLHKKYYKRAKKYIHKSMYYNKKDGYELGMLFPLLANLYLQYSLRQPLDYINLKKLVDKVHVYGFLQLSIALMENDLKQISELETQYEWLDFITTVKKYKEFFKLIRFLP